MGIFEDVINQSSRKPGGFPTVLERRSEKRLPLLRSSRTSMTSHLWELELVPAIAMNRLSGDIATLTTRALDTNIFFESEVVRAAWPRLTSLLAPHGCWMLCLWETIDTDRSLRLFMPVRVNKIGLPRHKVLQPLSNEFMPVGTPLIDADCAGEAAETLLRLLADPELSLPSILDLTHQRQCSESFQILVEAAKSLGLKTADTEIHQRAALVPKNTSGSFTEMSLGKKRKRELNRQLKKLETTGEVTFSTARTEEEVLDAFEGFMTLELKGWKGKRGTALYNHKKIAAFSRQIVAELAVKNGCEVFTLKHDNKNIAAVIMLGRNGHLVPWKMAFDESYGSFSPGMQIMAEATDQLINRKDFKEADSLAVSGHWMMNRVWPDRITMQDLAIALTPQGEQDLHELVRAKTRLSSIKKFAKMTLQKLKKLASVF